ncbi:hypothetical protein FB451DRAFT_1187628 [Mycena latifolia]|nr:hypothetical protein FB451DRAFT_1187628 [Mycena latifolia]
MSADARGLLNISYLRVRVQGSVGPERQGRNTGSNTANREEGGGETAQTSAGEQDEDGTSTRGAGSREHSEEGGIRSREGGGQEEGSTKEEEGRTGGGGRKDRRKEGGKEEGRKDDLDAESLYSDNEEVRSRHFLHRWQLRSFQAPYVFLCRASLSIVYAEGIFFEVTASKLWGDDCRAVRLSTSATSVGPDF